MCFFGDNYVAVLYRVRKKKDKPADSTDSGSQVVSVESTETLKEKTVSKCDLPRKYNVPLADVYIDAPAWQEIEKGTTEVFIVQEEKFVSVTVSFDKANNLQEVHTLNGDSMMANLENFFMPQEIVIENQRHSDFNSRRCNQQRSARGHQNRDKNHCR